MKTLFVNGLDWSRQAEELSAKIKQALGEWVTQNPGYDPRDMQIVGQQTVADTVQWLIVKENIKTQKAPGFDPDDD